LSGRQAQIKTVQARSIVTHLEHATNDVATGRGTNSAGTPLPVAESFELGPIVDVVPVVRGDGNTLGLAIKASVQEFVGYDLDGGTRTVTTPDGRKELVKSSDPRPVFRKRELASDAVVWDGQTVVLSDGSDRLVGNPRTDLPLLGDLPFLGRLFRDESGRSGKTKLIIFVTPTLIDAAGNRIASP
jgi:type II secretory pathway component GspD/PulD (secretin)